MFMPSLNTTVCSKQCFQLTYLTVVRDIEVICSVSITRYNCAVVRSIYNTGWQPLTVWHHSPAQVNRRITRWYRLIWLQARYVVSSSICHGLDENLGIVVTRNGCQLRGARSLNKWCCEKKKYVHTRDYDQNLLVHIALNIDQRHFIAICMYVGRAKKYLTRVSFWTHFLPKRWARPDPRWFNFLIMWTKR